jgi:predicted DNA-binding protein YlxM (UPF0122 family)
MAEKESTTSFDELRAKFGDSTAETHWNMITKPIYENEYRKAFGDDSLNSHDYVDEQNKVVHHFEPQILERVIVDKYTLSDLVSWGMNKNRTKFDDEHLEKLKKQFEQEYDAKNSRSNLLSHNIDIYQITKNTIRVTEALMRQFPKKLSILSGYKKSDALYNSIKKHIKDGDKVCYVTLNYSGGGIDAYSVYQDDGAHGMTDIVEVEILGSEAG